jgi:Uma2 family endonuclease
MSAMQKTYVTADELYAIPKDGFKYELIRGELVKMPPAGFEHGDIGVKVASHLHSHVKKMQLGRVVAADTGYQLAADHVLAPDVSFVSESRLPTSGLPEGFFHGVPDLAIEVISPSERERHVSQKVDDYLRYGCKMIVVIRPRTRRVELYSPMRAMQTLEPGDVLDGGSVVPGWQLPIADIFD